MIYNFFNCIASKSYKQPFPMSQLLLHYLHSKNTFSLKLTQLYNPMTKMTVRFLFIYIKVLQLHVYYNYFTTNMSPKPKANPTLFTLIISKNSHGLHFHLNLPLMTCYIAFQTKNTAMLCNRSFLKH